MSVARNATIATTRGVGREDPVDRGDSSRVAYTGGLSTELTTVDRRAGPLATQRADASDDVFVLEEMRAQGSVLIRATRYTQSRASCALQLAGAGVPLTAIGAGVLGTLGAGLVVGAAGMGVLGLMMVLETSNRIAVTDHHLVIQTSILLHRYERDRIEDLRVETLGPRGWWRFDVCVLAPQYFFKKSSGLRFRYRKSRGKTTEVFVALADAHEYARLLGR